MKLHTPLFAAEGTGTGTGDNPQTRDEHADYRPRDERDDRPRGDRSEDRRPRGRRDDRDEHRDGERRERRDDRPRGERPPPTAEEVAREMLRLQVKQPKDEPKCPNPPTDKPKDEKPKGAGWYASGPTWFFNALGCTILVIIAIVAVKMLFPDFGVRSSFSGVGFNPAPSAPAPMMAPSDVPLAPQGDPILAAGSVSNERRLTVVGEPPKVRALLNGGAKVVLDQATNVIWKRYPGPVNPAHRVTPVP